MERGESWTKNIAYMGFILTHSVITVQYQYIRWLKFHFSICTVNCSTCCTPSNVWLSNFICNHFLCVLHVCRTDKLLPRDSLVSGDQETAIVLYTVVKFVQMCRGCWIYLFLFIFLLLWCIPSSYTIIWYLNFSSIFHLLQDYFTVVKWKLSVPIFPILTFPCSLLNYYYHL